MRFVALPVSICPSRLGCSRGHGGERFRTLSRSRFADSRAIGVPPRASRFASFSAGGVGRCRFASRLASGSGTLMPIFSGNRGVAMSGFRDALSVSSCAARLAVGLAVSCLTPRSRGRPNSGAALHRPPRAGACCLLRWAS